LEKVSRFFNVLVYRYKEDRAQNYDPGSGRKNILYTSTSTILPVTLFSINYRAYSKAHKSRLKYETKYDINKIARK